MRVLNYYLPGTYRYSYCRPWWPLRLWMGFRLGFLGQNTIHKLATTLSLGTQTSPRCFGEISSRSTTPPFQSQQHTHVYTQKKNKRTREKGKSNNTHLLTTFESVERPWGTTLILSSTFGGSISSSESPSAFAWNIQWILVFFFIVFFVLLGVEKGAEGWGRRLEGEGGVEFEGSKRKSWEGIREE